MIKVGVTGPVGAGKTTFSDLLKERFADCVVVCGDVLMKKIIADRADALKEQILGTINDDPLTLQDLYCTKERFELAFSLICKSLNEEIENQIKMTDKTHSIVIVEWNLLHRLPVWNSFEWKFYIKADSTIRFHRLIIRDQEVDQKKNAEKVQQRIQIMRDRVPLEQVILIQNDGVLEKLRKTAFSWADCIMRGIDL